MIFSFTTFLGKQAKAAPSIIVEPSTYTVVNHFTFTITEPIPGAVKYQYKTGEDIAWFNFNPILSNSVTLPDPVNHPNGAYINGENQFFFQALDGDDNVIESLNTIYKYADTTPPSQVQNLEVTPDTNSQNSFTATWDPPTKPYWGEESNLEYYYSINEWPTQYNTTKTNHQTSVGPSPLATRKDANIIFVVAQDEAGNIDYNNPNQYSFTANTISPPTPTNIIVNDISDKDSDQYRLVVSWAPPELADPDNFAGYDVYTATTESGTYSKLANTTQTAYVHTGLIQKSTHYYYVVSTDKTQNISAPSTTVHATADGRYTQPPKITQAPEVAAKSRTAIVNWGTSREANSSVEFGKNPALGQSIGKSVSLYETDHSVTLTNLEPNTLYYYKAVFTDPDNNTGQSTVLTFKTLPASFVSNLEVTSIGTTQMTISWETNAPAYGEVNYSTSLRYDNTKPEDIYYTRKHTLALTGLADGQLYNIRVKQKDEEGNIFYSDNYQATTVPLPKISDVKVQPKTEVETPTVLVEYKTNVDTSTIISYGSERIQTKQFVDLAYTRNHIVELSGLAALKNYTLRITARDRFGNEAATSETNVTTLSDSMPPKVSTQTEKIQIFGEGDNAEAQLIVHILTNEPSTAVIEAKRGIGKTDFDIISAKDGLNTEHTVILKLGDAGLPYSYRVRLADSTDNESVTDTKTIIVPEAKRSAFDFVLTAFSRSFGWLGKFFK